MDLNLCLVVACIISCAGAQLPVPFNVKCTEKMENSIKVTWDIDYGNLPKDSGEFVLSWSSALGQTNEPEDTVTTSNRHYNILKLDSATSYFIRVQFKKGHQTSELSHVYCNTTDLLLNVPSELSCIDHADTSLVITWKSDKETIPRAFAITWYPHHDHSLRKSLELRHPKGSHSFTIQNLIPGTKYGITVQTLSLVHEFTSSEVSDVAICTTTFGNKVVPSLSKPTLKCLMKSKSSIRLEWPSDRLTNKYNLRWYPVEGDDANVAEEVDLSDSHSYSVKQLAPATTYAFEVRSLSTDQTQYLDSIDSDPVECSTDTSRTFEVTFKFAFDLATGIDLGTRLDDVLVEMQRHSFEEFDPRISFIDIQPLVKVFEIAPRRGNDDIKLRRLKELLKDGVEWQSTLSKVIHFEIVET